MDILTPSLGRKIMYSLSVIVLVCTIIGIGLIIVSNASVVRAVVAQAPASEAEQAAFTTERQTEALRALGYVTGRASELEGSMPGSSRGYTQEEIFHMADVRLVMRLARTITMALIAISLLSALIVVKLKSYAALGRVLISAGILCTLALVIAALAGFIGFDELFSGFHTLFFSEGTWQFPEDSLLLTLFPLQFWMIEALVWAFSSLAAAVLAISVGALIRSSCVAKRASGVN